MSKEEALSYIKDKILELLIKKYELQLAGLEDWGKYEDTYSKEIWSIDSDITFRVQDAMSFLYDEEEDRDLHFDDYKTRD